MRRNALTSDDKTKLKSKTQKNGKRDRGKNFARKIKGGDDKGAIKKFENARPAGTNTSIYRYEPTRHGNVPPNQWKPVGKVPIHNNSRLRLYPIISEDKCAPRNDREEVASRRVGLHRRQYGTKSHHCGFIDAS
jgi:hypothetical protein